MTFVDPETYYASLPSVTLAAGGLLSDGAGRILLVKPTYRDYWQLPGGTVEDGEAPDEGCRREVFEEVGLDREVGRLLLVNWTPPRGGRRGLVLMVFDVGVVDAGGELRLAEGELEASAWVSPEEAVAMVSKRTALRLPEALAALADGGTRYLAC
ncbi:NUDIX hydrolase [Phytomonospora sp. NPDC050363]|uniref:NUDIX hydrolase n=1 Tax=Phytomonospora sp. NPDC050363 TaxID=3155642 RepID=UPI0033F927A2